MCLIVQWCYYIMSAASRVMRGVLCDERDGSFAVRCVDLLLFCGCRGTNNEVKNKNTIQSEAEGLQGARELKNSPDHTNDLLAKAVTGSYRYNVTPVPGTDRRQQSVPP